MQAIFAADPAGTKGRLFPEEESAHRTPFHRDRDRIIHSSAFRRLKHKTQVFVEHEGDYFRTRLTHSIEVAQVARTLANALGLNQELAEAVALAHDLGHTPFGHTGEDAMDELMQPYGGFDHNAQALKIVTSLERSYAEFDGLNLTWETLEGVAKHNGPLTGAIPPATAALDAAIDLQLKNHASAEAQLANLADDIAYLSHDFDDALRAGLFSFDVIAALPQVDRILSDINARYGALEPGRLTHELVRRLISVFVSDLLAASHEQLAALGADDVEGIRHHESPVICFSAEMARDLEVLRDFLFTNMWRHYKVNRMTSKAKRVVTDLFNLFMSETNTLPMEWQNGPAGNIAEGEVADRARIIADYVASMTDRYAILEHQRLFELGPILR